VSFPVYSTSVQTPRCKRGIAVVQRIRIAYRVKAAAVFACRPTSGTSLWSPHALGDAVDLMLHLVSRVDAETVGRAVVRQATNKTVPNRGRRIQAVHVIFGKTEWVAGVGFRPYGGVAHDNHVHVGFSFSTAAKPPCAG